MPISSNFRQILPTTIDSVALSLYLSPSSAQQTHLSKNCTFWMSYVCLQQNVRLPTKYFELFVALRNFDLVYPSYSAGVYSTGKLYQMHYATQILPTIVVKNNFFWSFFFVTRFPYSFLKTQDEVPTEKSTKHRLCNVEPSNKRNAFFPVCHNCRLFHFQFLGISNWGNDKLVLVVFSLLYYIYLMAKTETEWMIQKFERGVLHDKTKRNENYFSSGALSIYIS